MEKVAIRNSKLLHFLIGLLLTACTGGYTVEEYVNHVNTDEAYVKRQSAGEYVLTCQYRPADYLACSELQQRPAIDQVQFEQTKRVFQNALYFTLRISRADSVNVLTYGVQNQQQYSFRLNYLTGYMGEDFYILTSAGEKVKPAIYEYQRSYGNSPDAYLIFSFPASSLSEKENEIQLVYEDKLFDIQGPVRWNFSLQDLKNRQPKIKLPS